MPDDPIDLGEARQRKRGKPAVREAVLNAAPAAARPQPAAAPDGEGGRLTMTERGLFRRTDDGLRLVSGPFQVAAQTRDETGNEWGLLVRFNDPDGVLQSIVVTRNLFTGEKTEIAATLALRGLFVQPGRSPALALNEYLARALLTAEARVRVVTRTGWHRIDGVSVFVLPGEIIGDAKTGVLYQPEASEPPPFNATGTLEQWQDEIADRCTGNTRLMLAVCCAFAAPLLGPLGEQGGGFHFHGKSSSGKTTALRVAASVWGGEAGAGAIGYVRQWRATGNGVEGLAQAHSDALLGMDEIGTADPATLGETAYMLANGRGRERLDRAGRARRAVKFRSLFLSTGEPSFADKLAEVAKLPRAGQEVRMIDLASDAGAGLGLFECLHDEKSAEAFVSALRTATASCYGVAGPAFLRNLVDRLAAEPDLIEALQDWAASLVREWLSPWPDADGQVRNVARRFALLAVAGELATKAAITSWTPDAATEAVGTCLRAWLAERGTAGAREDVQAVQQLRDFLARHGASRFEDWRDSDPQADALQGDPDAQPPATRFRPVNRAGWRRWVAEGGGRHGWRYYLTRDGMAEALGGLDRRQAHQALIARGFLLPDAAGKPSRPVKPPGHPKARLYEVLGSILAAEDGAD
jgi:putative DNA primase/helicase